MIRKIDVSSVLLPQHEAFGDTAPPYSSASGLCSPETRGREMDSGNASRLEEEAQPRALGGH